MRRTRPPTALDIAVQLEQVANAQEKIAKQVSSQLCKDEDVLEKLLEHQSELVQTVSDVSTQVAKQQWPSKLIPDRMDELVKSIAAADRMLRDQSETEFKPQANTVSDEARELAAHIRGLNPEEPLESLSALAAMAQQAAKMEVELADAQQPLQETRWRRHDELSRLGAYSNRIGRRGTSPSAGNSSIHHGTNQRGSKHSSSSALH